MKKLTLVPTMLLILAGCSSKEQTPAPQATTPTVVAGTPTVRVYDFNDKYPKKAMLLITEEWQDYPYVKDYFKTECKLQAFMKALAFMESNYKLTTQYKEPKINGKMRKDAVTKRYIVSEGLFQMSYQDSKYWGCGFKYGADKYMRDENQNLKLLTIFRAEVQTDCALNILNRMIKAEGKPFYNRSSTIANYWYPLKPRNGSKHKKFQNLYSKNRIAFCK